MFKRDKSDPKEYAWNDFDRKTYGQRLFKKDASDTLKMIYTTKNKLQFLTNPIINCNQAHVTCNLGRNVAHVHPMD